MAAHKKAVKKIVKERFPVAPPAKVIPDRRKEEEKKKCREKVKPDQ